MGHEEFDINKIDQLVFTKAVISETLRLYPPIWVLNRSAIEDDELLGHKFPKKSMIVLSIYHMHRNPKYWDKPNEFIPQRFIDNDYSNVQYYAPFSHGKRQCIGKEFVLMELLLMAAMTVQRYHLKQNKSGPIKFRPLITLRPEGCPRLLIQRRS
jgi:cytochrome P450